jgi:8-oxo-dGTP diphosphatase
MQSLLQLRTIAAKLYWRLFRPKSYGVKAAILHPLDPSLVLLVRHSYDSGAWNLPGGGYNPKRETPERSIARELMEELATRCRSYVYLGEYFTESEGKRDTVTLFACTPVTAQFTTDNEIAEIKWVPFSDLAQDNSYYRVVRTTARLLLTRERGSPNP